MKKGKLSLSDSLLHCYNCYCKRSMVLSSLGTNQEEVSKALRRNGWKKTKQYGWKCPSCDDKETSQLRF